MQDRGIYESRVNTTPRKQTASEQRRTEHEEHGQSGDMGVGTGRLL